MKFRRWVVHKVNSLVMPLAFVTAALFVLFVGSLIYFVLAEKSDAIFLIEAETSRFEFTVANPERSVLPIVGAKIISDQKLVVMLRSEANALDRPRYCYDGVLRPAVGTTLEFSFNEGLQQIMMHEPERDLVSEPRAKIATLDQSLANYQIGENLPVVFDDDGTDSTDELLTVGVGGTGNLALTGLTVITIEPSCFEENIEEKDRIAFVPREEPLIIDGFGALGSRLVRNDYEPGNVGFEPDLEFIAGEISIIPRATVCPLSRQEDGSCKGVFQLQNDPVEIPSNSALGTDGTNQEHFMGHAYFDDGMYQVHVSATSSDLSMLQPYYEETSGSRVSMLGLTPLDRLLVEPIVVISGSFFLTFLGLTVGFLQVEVHEELSERKIGKKAKQRKTSESRKLAKSRNDPAPISPDT